MSLSVCRSEYLGPCVIVHVYLFLPSVSVCVRIGVCRCVFVRVCRSTCVSVSVVSKKVIHKRDGSGST